MRRSETMGDLGDRGRGGSIAGGTGRNGRGGSWLGGDVDPVSPVLTNFHFRMFVNLRWVIQDGIVGSLFAIPGPCFTFTFLSSSISIWTS